MSRNTWTRDEYLVTLDLYLNRPEVVEDKDDPLVQETASLISRTPGAVALRLANYRHLDPQSTEGMSHVSEDCREIWEEYYRNDDELAYEANLARQRLASVNEDSVKTEEYRSVQTGEVNTQQKSRIGQSDFRSLVRSQYQDTCLLCDISTPGLLQAGHILDWSEFEELRGDPGNGILLCYNHHRAFDLGIFTISETHDLIVRPEFSDGGAYLERTLNDRETINFPGQSPAKEYLKRRNERLSWWPPEDHDEAG